LGIDKRIMTYALAFLDDRFTNPDEADILTVHALHYATAVFEGIRVYDGRAFKLAEHVERLLRSALVIGLQPDIDAGRCAVVLEEMIMRSGLRNAYLRPVMFQGGVDLGVHAPSNKTRFGALIWDWPTVFGVSAMQKGIALTTQVPYRRPPPSCFPTEAKSSAGYLTGAVNRRHAAEAGFDDALMLTHDGFVAEASGANIFAFHSGALLTPRPSGILDGITRQTVMAHLPEGLTCRECDLDLSTLLEADEVFLTGTAYEIMPVRAIDGTRFQPGPQTRLIADIYQTLTCADYPSPAQSEK